MALLDVNSILYDPMFTEYFTLIRRTEVVGPTGVVSVTGVSYPNIPGVITPAHTVMRTSANDVRRMPTYETQTRTITVVSPYFIQGIVLTGATSSHPDIIQWKGDNYEVKSVNPLPQFGRGFMEVEAISVDYIDLQFVVPGSIKGAMMFNKAANSGLLGVA